MGIKDLSKFIRDKKINCFVENYPLSNLKGYRVGIDANNFIFVYGAGIHKDAIYKSTDVVDGEMDREELLRKLFLRVLNFLIIFMNNGVTPVLVFDGKAEIEKTVNVRSVVKRVKNKNRESKILKLKWKKSRHGFEMLEILEMFRKICGKLRFVILNLKKS